MAARDLIRRTLFPPSLVRCLRYRLRLLSKASILQVISKKKYFKPQCWNVNENCDVDLTIDRAGFQLKKKKNSGKKTTLQVFFVLFTRATSTSVIIPFSSSTAYAVKVNSKKKKTLFVGIHIYCRGIAGFTEQRTAFTHAQVRSCKVKILICVFNAS